METTLNTTNVTATNVTRRIVRHLPTVGRVLLAIPFFVLGLDGFLHFVPVPADMPEGVMAFGGAMMATGYLFPLVKGTEVLVGTLLLANRFVPLALAILAPVLINIVAFNAFLNPSQIGLPLVLLALEISLAWSYRKVYRPMLAARNTAGAT